MYAADPLYNLEGRRVHQLMKGSKQVGGKIEIPKWEKVADFRIVVDGNEVTTYTNGVKVHQKYFDAPIDPWLVLQADYPWFFTSIESLEIRGSPEILSEIDLINLAEGGGWRASYFEENAAGPTLISPYYDIANGEINGAIRSDVSAKNVESLIQYSRPMLEDGEIEYEFYYVPDRTLVHPAIGRQAIILQQDKAVLHPLTEGRFETNEDSTTITQEIDQSKNIRLREKDWNHVLLRIVGDRLTLLLNGEEVATINIAEPKNERFFGLFRYADREQNEGP